MNGNYLKVSDIVFITTVQTNKGERQWNATMTKELIAPDTYFIVIKLSIHELTLQYKNKNDAFEDYNNIRIRLGKD